MLNESWERCDSEEMSTIHDGMRRSAFFQQFNNQIMREVIDTKGELVALLGGVIISSKTAALSKGPSILSTIWVFVHSLVWPEPSPLIHRPREYHCLSFLCLVNPCWMKRSDYKSLLFLFFTLCSPRQNDPGACVLTLYRVIAEPAGPPWRICLLNGWH